MNKTGNMMTLLVLLAMVISCGKKGGDGPTPQLNFSDISVNEGNGGINNIEFELTLNTAPSKQVSLTWSTIEGTAKAGSDFTAVSAQTITFQPNEKVKKLVIAVVADDIKETDETFRCVSTIHRTWCC